MAMTTYSGLRGWLRKLHCYDDDLSQDPNEFGRYQTSVGIKCADEPPYRPGDWIEAVFRPHNQAMDDLTRLSAEHPELGRQIRDVLDQAEAAYSRFVKASATEEPSDSVMLTAYPANAADLAWWHLQDPISNLQRRLTVALGLLDALPTGHGTTPKQRPASANARMLDVLTRKPECRGWTISQWRRELKCAASTIQGTPTWRELQAARELLSVDHATTKRRRSKGRRSRARLDPNTER